MFTVQFTFGIRRRIDRFRISSFFVLRLLDCSPAGREPGHILRFVPLPVPGSNGRLPPEELPRPECTNRQISPLLPPPSHRRAPPWSLPKPELDLAWQHLRFWPAAQRPLTPMGSGTFASLRRISHSHFFNVTEPDEPSQRVFKKRRGCAQSQGFNECVAFVFPEVTGFVDSQRWWTGNSPGEASAILE